MRNKKSLPLTRVRVSGGHPHPYTGEAVWRFFKITYYKIILKLSI